MSSRLIIDGNAVYEIDEDCIKKKKEQESRTQKERTWYFYCQGEERQSTEES